MKIAPNSGASRAFSLVEVTIALGVVSFALVAIFGLLPVGLRSVRDSREQAAAASVISRISDEIRNGQVTNDFTEERTLGGSVPTNSSDARLKVVVDLTSPSATPGSLGTATIRVAWPATAVPTATNWTGAMGSLSTGFQYLPKP